MLQGKGPQEVLDWVQKMVRHKYSVIMSYLPFCFPKILFFDLKHTTSINNNLMSDSFNSSSDIYESLSP